MGDDDLLWGGLQTIESFAELAPWLFDHHVIAQLANHNNFSVRSTAASICLDMTQFAPELVPVDILFKLAAYDEDWYVMTPATESLVTIAKSRPAVLRAIFTRLSSQDAGVREHAARAIADIAREKPRILEQEELKQELARLEKMRD
jgi:HEAT repeat protein